LNLANPELGDIVPGVFTLVLVKPLDPVVSVTHKMRGLTHALASAVPTA
jgi:hypothetical protein